MESNSDSEWATKASDDSSIESDKLEIIEDSFSNSGSKVEILEDIVIRPSVRVTKKCYFCEKNIDKGIFDEHRKIHEITFFHCQYNGCNKKFKRKSSLRKHNYIHKGKFKYECKDCDIKFIDLIKFQNHLNIKHEIARNENFMCKEKDCGKTFATVDYLRQHQITHKDEFKYSCNDCNLKFKWMSSWQSHKLVHTKLDKALKCKFCFKSFSSQRTLERHNKIHKNMKFKCKICEKINSTRKDNIRRHIRHLHSDIEKNKVSDHIIEFYETNINSDDEIDEKMSTDDLSNTKSKIVEKSKASVKLQIEDQVLSYRVGVITSVGNPNKNLSHRENNNETSESTNSKYICIKSQELEVKPPPKKNPIALNETMSNNQLLTNKLKYDPIEHYRKILLGTSNLDDEQEHEHEAPTQIHWRKRASQNFLHHQ